MGTDWSADQRGRKRVDDDDDVCIGRGLVIMCRVMTLRLRPVIRFLILSAKFSSFNRQKEKVRTVVV